MTDNKEKIAELEEQLRILKAREAERSHERKLLGGDCSSGSHRLLSVTALGRLGPLRLLRNAAQPGDVLISSGPHGLSRLGLALLQKDPLLQTTRLSAALQELAISQPQPRTGLISLLMASNGRRPVESVT